MMFLSLKTNRNGFTLIELLITMVIAGLSLGAIYSVYASVQKSSTSNDVTARVLQKLRTSMAFMESDIRMAGLDRFGTAGAGFEAATSASIRITSDRNMDGTINTADLSDGLQDQDLERITYAYDASGKQLRQCLSEGTKDYWETLADNVDNCSFSYLDKNGATTANPASIRTVVISMTVKQPSGRSGYITRTMTRQILCRNMAMK